MIALLSIKPEYVEKIFSGDKWFEYRKVVFKKNVEKVIVYSTKPVGLIVGEFSIEDIIEGTPKDIWNITKQKSGIEKGCYDSYFRGKKFGYAIKIRKTTLYTDPIDPKSILSSFVPPQSFYYLPYRALSALKLDDTL